MDEAFSALDPIIRTEMQSEPLRLQQMKCRTIVFISLHDLDEAMRIGDHIAIMKDGEVVQVGTPDEILRQPATDYMRDFRQRRRCRRRVQRVTLHARLLPWCRSKAIGAAAPHCACWKIPTAMWPTSLTAAKHYLGTVLAASLREALHGHQGLWACSTHFRGRAHLAADTPVAELFWPHGQCAVPAARVRYPGPPGRGQPHHLMRFL